MRIHDALTRQGVGKKISGPNRTKSSETSLFAEELSLHNDEGDQYDREIETLRQEIDKAGDKLTKEPTLQNFKLFRELLSRLAKKINSEAYRLEKFGGTAQNPRYFEFITIINNEADKLYEMIINEHRNHMDITAKVIGIKGLVVDLIT